MAIKERNITDRIEIDISGPDGNAFALLGYANRFAKQIGKDGKAITTRMKEGDYEHLLKVFDEEFGKYIDLVR